MNQWTTQKKSFAAEPSPVMSSEMTNKQYEHAKKIPSPKFNSSPLKSYQKPNRTQSSSNFQPSFFRGEMLNFGEAWIHPVWPGRSLPSALPSWALSWWPEGESREVDALKPSWNSGITRRWKHPRIHPETFREFTRKHVDFFIFGWRFGKGDAADQNQDGKIHYIIIPSPSLYQSFFFIRDETTSETLDTVAQCRSLYISIYSGYSIWFHHVSGVFPLAMLLFTGGKIYCTKISKLLRKLSFPTFPRKPAIGPYLWDTPTS